MKRALMVICGTGLAAFAARSQDTFTTLKVGDDTFSNVVVNGRSGNQLFLRHQGGLQTVRLEDLSPELQKHFGYDPSLAAAAPVPEPRLPIAPATNEVVAPSAPVRPPGTALAKYSLGTLGTLCLYQPDTWKSTFVASPPGTAPYATIRFERIFDADFEMVVTTIPSNSPLKKLGGRGVLEMTGGFALRTAVEDHLQIEPIKGAETTGSYFTLTDRNLQNVTEPKPGRYKYQTQGYVELPATALSFGVVCNYTNTADFWYALSMITNAFVMEKSASIVERPAEPTH